MCSSVIGGWFHIKLWSETVKFLPFRKAEIFFREESSLLCWIQNFIFIMSLSLCSLTRVSPQIHVPNSQWSRNAKRSIFSLSLTLTSNSSRCICRVVEQGLEVEAASADTALQKQSPVINTKEEQRQEVSNGVASTESDNKALNSSYRVKKKRDDDESYENRFKLQNGREVSYLFHF